jgi:hypothetical protein
MPAIKRDIMIEQWADFQREYTVLDADGIQLPNFAAFTGAGELRDSSGTILAAFTVTVTGPQTVLAALTSAQVAVLAATAGFSNKYAIRITSPTGLVYRVAHGQAFVSAE